MPIHVVRDERGALGAVNGSIDLPFRINRVYYLFDITSKSLRGEHAHKRLQQLLIALTGSLDVTLNDGSNECTYHLNDPSIGLYVPPGYWRRLSEFSSASTLLVLASSHYDEKDYIRDWEAFLEWKGRS